MKVLVVSVVLTVAAGASNALERVPDSKCAPKMAVQYDDCTVVRISNCQMGDKDVIQHVTVEKDEADYIDIYTNDYDLLQSFDEIGDVALLGIIDNRDAFSVERILLEGSDQVDQTVSFKLPFFVDGSPADSSGTYKLTGETVDVGGESFDKGDFSFDARFQLNAIKVQMHGEFFLHRETGTFLEGKAIIDFGGMVTEYPSEPMRVLWPNDPDYNDESLIYQCENYSLKSSLRNLAKG